MSHKSRRRRQPRRRLLGPLATSTQLQELRSYGFETMGPLGEDAAATLLEAFRGD